MWLVMKDIDIGKAAQIKRGAGADEGKARRGKLLALLAFQHLVQMRTDLMKIQYITGCIIGLFGAEAGGAPVG